MNFDVIDLIVSIFNFNLHYIEIFIEISDIFVKMDDNGEISLKIGRLYTKYDFSFKTRNLDPKDNLIIITTSSEGLNFVSIIYSHNVSSLGFLISYIVFFSEHPRNSMRMTLFGVNGSLLKIFMFVLSLCAC